MKKPERKIIAFCIVSFILAVISAGIYHAQPNPNDGCSLLIGFAGEVFLATTLMTAILRMMALMERRNKGIPN